MSSARITCIGLGNMGSALARVLFAGSSSQLTLWNRTPDRPQIQALAAQGAVFEPDIAAAVAGSDTIVICLLDYPTITSVFSVLEGLNKDQPLTGKTIINLTNGTPSQARAAATHFKQTLGAAAYFDGGIMVTPQQVGTPESFVVLSGESRARYDALARELPKPIGAVLYLSSVVRRSHSDVQKAENDEEESDPGAAALYDLAALAGLIGIYIGSFTGFALLKQGLRSRTPTTKRPAATGKDGDTPANVKIRPGVDAVMVPFLKAIVPHVGLLAEALDREAWMDDNGNPLAMQLAALRNIVQACEEEGVDGTGLEFLGRLMERAVEDGFGPGGIVSIVRYLLK